MFDVIVVGAGPAGSAAAKRCAESGLKTLMLEKESLPRERVCDGGLYSDGAQSLVKQEFGDIPRSVLSEPPYFSGFIFHIPGVSSKTVDFRFPTTWRRDFDYWLNQKAQAEGAEIWDGSRVLGVTEKKHGFSVKIRKDKEERLVEARFVVGAEGAVSTVRSSLFPDLKLDCFQQAQMRYRGELDLDRDYYHEFPEPKDPEASVGVTQKDGLIVVSFLARWGQLKTQMQWVNDFLAKHYGFDVNQKPVWRKGTQTPSFWKELISGTFRPAKGNALLVGDAGGFMTPVAGEGIGPGMRSGLLAATSITRAIESGEQAEGIYLKQVEGILSEFREFLALEEKDLKAIKVADARTRLKVHAEAFMAIASGWKFERT